MLLLIKNILLLVKHVLRLVKHVLLLVKNVLLLVKHVLLLVKQHYDRSSQVSAECHLSKTIQPTKQAMCVCRAEGEVRGLGEGGGTEYGSYK